MRVLIGCEFSGVVRDAFRRKGHTAFSCDILPSESRMHGSYGYHFQCDLFDLLAGKWPHDAGQRPWDLLIFHWPSTYMTNAGARWLYQGGRGTVRDGARWSAMEADARSFKRLLESDIPSIAGENPIMHRHAAKIVETPYTQIIQPWQYGHGETKATCLWLKNLPPLVPTNIVEGREPRVHHASPGPNRCKERSRTLQGIADAMADQWNF